MQLGQSSSVLFLKAPSGGGTQTVSLEYMFADITPAIPGPWQVNDMTAFGFSAGDVLQIELYNNTNFNPSRSFAVQTSFTEPMQSFDLQRQEKVVQLVRVNDDGTILSRISQAIVVGQTWIRVRNRLKLI